jgi:hypothetical protein
VEALVAEPADRVVGDERSQRARSPPGLLERLALGRLLRRLAGVDPAAGDLPAPAVDDEAMAVEEQTPRSSSCATTAAASCGIRTTWCPNRLPSGSSTSARLREIQSLS